MLPTSTTLIGRLRDLCDGDSWREFVTLYEPLLLAYVRKRGVVEAEAGDVVQEVFIKLLRALPEFKLDHQRGRFRTWLWRLTMNVLADHYRKQRGRRRGEEGWRQRAAFEQGGPSADGASAGGDPDAAFLALHRQRVLDHVLPKVRSQTQSKTWHCFEQYVLRGRPGAEIAREVGLPANTVYVHSSRVLDKVRALCADYFEELDDDQPLLPE